MANEAKWSAAPWGIGRGDRKADGAKIYVRCARRIDGAPAGIAVAHVLAAPGRAEQLANADIIGAAPELYAALSELLQVLPAAAPKLDAGAVLARARAAIAQAEGR